MSESRIPRSGWNWYAEPDSQPAIHVIEPPVKASPKKRGKKRKRVAYGFARALNTGEHTMSNDGWSADNETPEAATRLALDIDGIKSASFRRRNDGRINGVMYDDHTGQEYDVTREGMTWRVNDDNGRDFRMLGLAMAIEQARAARADGEPMVTLGPLGAGEQRLPLREAARLAVERHGREARNIEVVAKLPVHRAYWDEVERLLDERTETRAARLAKLIDAYSIESVHVESGDARPTLRYAAVSRSSESDTADSAVTTFDTFDEACDELGGEVIDSGRLPEAIFDLDTGERIEVEIRTPFVTRSQDQGVIVNPLDDEGADSLKPRPPREYSLAADIHGVHGAETIEQVEAGAGTCTDEQLAGIVDVTLRELRSRAETQLADDDTGAGRLEEIDRVCDAWDTVRESYTPPSTPPLGEATAEHIGWALLRWAGLAADDENRATAPLEAIERFADALQHSSVPDACAAIVDR